MSCSNRRLESLTSTLLDPAADPGLQQQACEALYEYLVERVDWDDPPMDMDRETQLQEGVAISPRDAVRCILDSTRTTAFLRGVDRAIRQMRERHPERPVQLLYAGCGPLAPLVVPLLPRYHADELQVSLLEIHEGSLNSAFRLCGSLSLSDRIAGAIHGDALDFEAPEGIRWDVCVVEMLQMALEKEPQLAVTARLAPQIAEDGILVPERISLLAALSDLSSEFRLLPETGEERSSSEGTEHRRRVDLGTILELDRTSAPALIAAAENASTDPDSFSPQLPGVEFDVPADLEAGCFTPIIRTRLQVAPGIILDDYDSGLTVPRVLHSQGKATPGESLAFSYRLGERPGIELHLVS